MRVILIILALMLSYCGTEQQQQQQEQERDDKTIKAVREATREASETLEGITIKDYLCLASCEFLDKAKVECEKCE